MSARTVNMRAAYNRLHRKMRETQRANKNLTEVNNHLHGEVMRLQRKLRTRQEIALPEWYLDKVMEHFITEVARGFAQRAFDAGARLPQVAILEAAKMLVAEGMRHHTLSTLDLPLQFIVEDCLESAEESIRLSFSTNGPVAVNYAMNPKAETGRYTRHIAKNDGERYYQISQLGDYVTDYMNRVDRDSSVQVRNVFHSH